MVTPGRSFSAGNQYRYGFNGKENDPSISAGAQDYGMRISDTRLGRFLSVDPLAETYPWYTPYQFAGNMPIWAVDLDGQEEMKANSVFHIIKDVNGNLIDKPTKVRISSTYGSGLTGVSRLDDNYIEVTPGFSNKNGNYEYYNTFIWQQVEGDKFSASQTSTAVGQDVMGKKPPQTNLVQKNDGDNDVTVPNNPKPVIKQPIINGKPLGNSPINLPLSVSFDANTDNINNKVSVMKQVRQIVNTLKSDPTISITLLGNVQQSQGAIAGPNDPTTLNGQPSTTKGLQIARAKAVANLLIKQGVSPKQVKYGSGTVSRNVKKGLSTDAIIKRKG